MKIIYDLETGKITGKFSGTEFPIPAREDLKKVDLEDLSMSMLSEVISDNFLIAQKTGKDANEQMQKGFKAVRQLKAWLDEYRDSDPTICAECTQQM